MIATTVETLPPSTASTAASGTPEARTWKARLQSGVLLAVLLCVVHPAGARDRPAHPLFESDAALAVTLAAPWGQVVRKGGAAGPRAAVLTYADAQGKLHRLEATVETRGITRLRICRFPPLWIRFAPGVTKGTMFAGQRSLKLVTHCRDGERHAQYYVQEMLAYRIYTLLTPHSFRVRPLEITYEDTGSGNHDGRRFAFVIEELSDVARRNRNEVSSQTEFRTGDYDPQALTRFMLFQYLIGNTDWDTHGGPTPRACCHNVRVLEGAGAHSRIAVPYDFDSSGLVDANYAAPDERLPIDSVTERLYRGFCVHNGALEAVREEFRSRRAAILALIAAEPRLSPDRRRAATAYVEDFYAVLGDDAHFAREISGKCRR